MNGALLMALQLMQSLPALVKAGQDIAELVQTQSAKIKAMADENRDPTSEEWYELNKQIDALRGQLHQD